MGCVSRYTEILDKVKIFVIIFWIIILGFSCWLGPRFLSRTTNAFDPPASSDAAHAETLLEQAFPTQAKVTSDLVIFIWSNVNTSLLGEDLKNFTLSINASAWEFPTCDNKCVQQIAGWYIFDALGFPNQTKTSFMAKDNTVTIIPLVINYPFTAVEAITFATYLQDEMKRLKPETADWGMELMGIPAFIPVMQASIERDFALMDGIVLPLAILVLAFILKSFRLLILPLVCTFPSHTAVATLCPKSFSSELGVTANTSHAAMCPQAIALLSTSFYGMGVSALCSFFILYFVSYGIQIVAFAPSLMMSLMVAMSIDYSLFLLSRYREELIGGCQPIEAVEQTLGTAGHTITVSGLTLAVCFLGLVVLPLNLMQSLGIACATTLLVVLIVHLTLLPSLLLTFSTFFQKSVEIFYCCGYPISFGSRDDAADMMAINNAGTVNEETHVLVSKVQYAVGTIGTNTPDHPFVSNLEHLVSCATWKWILKPPVNFIILICTIGFLIPFCFYLYPYATSDDIGMTLPYGTNSTLAYEKMISDFGYGTMYPYRMLLIPGDNKTVMDPTFYKTISTIVTNFSATVPNTTTLNFAGFSYGQGYNLGIEVSRCLGPPKKNDSLCEAIEFAISSFVNPGKNATYLLVSLDFNPLGGSGDAWYLAAKKATEALSKDLNMSITLSGIGASSMDAIDVVNRQFLTMLLITAAIVLAFVAFSFRSLFLLIRSILTIGLTIIWVYGFADLVYEHGILDWMHFRGLQGYGAIHWCPPIISFSIIVGIGLDYDIFLLVRIKEFRDLGYSTNESIALGISKTGHIITAAGVIMAIAFCGLLFSSVSVMNMLSFYMVFAVLFDTFIVRTFVVPALMSLVGDLNWWPNCVPPVTERVEGEPPSDLPSNWEQEPALVVQ